MRTRLAALVLLAALSPAESDAAPRRRVVDRIVAVVDADCITHRELERFAAPLEARASRELKGNEAARGDALRAIRREAIETLVDRRLLAREAERLHLVVTPSEVDRALVAVAAQNRIAVAQLLQAAKEEGYPEASYRAELHAQIVEGKLLELDAPKRYADWRVLSSEARIERMGRALEALKKELRARSVVEVRLP